MFSIAVLSRFPSVVHATSTTAVYAPAVLSDANGNAEGTIKMPGNLTSFRVMAVVLDR